ncbi:hypothetical protein, partial [Pseudomonas syringae group genomosp. 3]|uniref:hypothetical protein n=1 Tax=Pseudomonas syringae group genomosp. 3 TaxID=251701 RepID=UPI001E3821D3
SQRAKLGARAYQTMKVKNSAPWRGPAYLCLRVADTVPRPAFSFNAAKPVMVLRKVLVSCSACGTFTFADCLTAGLVGPSGTGSGLRRLWYVAYDFFGNVALL